MNESGVEQPEKINVLIDGAGYWHGTLLPVALRYNVLFADSHVKNCSRLQADQAWRTPLNASTSSPFARSLINGH